MFLYVELEYKKQQSDTTATANFTPIKIRVIIDILSNFSLCYTEVKGNEYSSILFLCSIQKF